MVGEELCLQDDGGGLVNKVFGGEDIKIDFLELLLHFLHFLLRF